MFGEGNMSERSRIFNIARKLFIFSSWCGGFSILSWFVFGIIEWFFVPDVLANAGSFETVPQTLLSVYFGVVMIAVPALLPFFSLFYLLVAVFTGDGLDNVALRLSTFAILACSLAILIAIPDEMCKTLTEDGGNCFGYKLGFLFDQLSKGIFADIFDVFSLKLSPLSLDEMGALVKIYVLNFRMLSALYVVALVMAVYQRVKKAKPKPDEVLAK